MSGFCVSGFCGYHCLFVASFSLLQPSVEGPVCLPSNTQAPTHHGRNKQPNATYLKIRCTVAEP